jgi:2,3-bisphosphoglycerate-independent phosphoglycerate mutase
VARELGYRDAPLYTPQRRRRTCCGMLSQPHDFVFFEVWHDAMCSAMRATGRGRCAFSSASMAFWPGCWQSADLAQTLIIVTSDHGNVEDCRHGKHTTNPALTLLLGAERHRRYAAQVS